jgi:hypothetical protein
VTFTVSEQLPVCGGSSTFVAWTATVYVPAGTASLTTTVAVAVPPVVDAGTTSIRLMEPGAGAGVTESIAREVTVPSRSVAETDLVAAKPSTAVSGPPQTAFGRGTPWKPRPPNVSVAKPSHSTVGSKASVSFVSPASIAAFRRSVLSAVLVSPVPHSAPGSKPRWPIASITTPLFRSSTASSPLNQPEPSVWSACARIVALAAELATTKTSPAATVPFSGIVSVQTGLPLKHICRSYAPVSVTGADVPLKISSALLLLEPSMYSEKNSSDGAASALGVAAAAATSATTTNRRRSMRFPLGWTPLGAGLVRSRRRDPTHRTHPKWSRCGDGEVRSGGGEWRHADRRRGRLGHDRHGPDSRPRRSGARGRPPRSARARRPG